eukprot:c13488_g1_i2 orf=631-1812(-)
MSQLGPVGVGLSVVFALFMLVLSVELYYVWRCRQRRLRAGGVRISANVAAQVPPAMAVKVVQLKLSTWRQMVAASWSAVGAEEAKRWAKLRLHSVLRRPAQPSTVGGVVEEGKASESEGGEKLEEEEEEEEDVFRVGGLWGPPRLLFTIPEETKEEMDLEEEVQSRAGGKGSLRASCASSELLFVLSACTSPFVTPPSSPPFATPFGSPAHALSLSCKPFNNSMDRESTSSSTSTSTSSPSPPLGCHPDSALLEDTSSFSSSSASATPSTRSPSILPPYSSPPTPNKRQHHPLCLLLDPPPSPSSALYHYHNRVHPLTSPPPLGCFHIDGNPVLSHSLPLEKPSEPPPPLSSFHLPTPSQPTTPCPFRASLHSKSMGFLVSPAPAPTFHFAEV